MIDNDFKIPKKYYAGPNNNVNLDWMNDKIGYEETAEEAASVYTKKSNGNELKLIKDFITKINNGSINNKNKAGNEFRKLKQKVTNDRLKQDLIKDLERYIFGDLESIEPEEKYKESIAERVKTRKQKTSASSNPPKKDYSKETADYLKYIEEQEKGQKRFSNDYDSNGWFSGSGSEASKAKGDGNIVSKPKGAGLKILTDKCLIVYLYYLLKYKHKIIQ